MMSNKNKKKIVEKIETKKAEAEKLKSLQNAFDSIDDYDMSQKEKMLERAANAKREADQLETEINSKETY